MISSAELLLKTPSNYYDYLKAIPAEKRVILRL